MANKKYKLTDGNMWATDGIHDFGQNKTQRTINSEVNSALGGKAPTNHASTATTYGAASTSNYGHVKLSNTTPSMDGTAAVGDSTDVARANHVHPSDTSRVPTSRKVNNKQLSSDITLAASDVGAAPTSHASTATTYGKGTSSKYGHVKISDSLTDTTPAATGGVVPSMKAVSDLNGAINGKMPANPTNIELTPQSGASNGGYIDFHYAGSSADYTSRLIESASGVLSVSGGMQLGSPLPVVSGGTGNNSVDTTPTEGSSKMVTSGGVYEAIKEDPKIKGNFIAQNAYLEISKVNQNDPSLMMQINILNNLGTECGFYLALINTVGQVAVVGGIPITNLNITTGTNKIKIQNTSGSISYYLNIIVFSHTTPIQIYRSDTGLTS